MNAYRTLRPLVFAALVASACHTAGPPSPTAPASVPPTTTEPAPSEPTVPASADGAVEAEVYTNTIRWSTASEVDNFGFDVFRSLHPDGSFERLNTDTIEGAGTVDEPSKYHFVDDTIDPHTTYYYYVESISMAGVRERFTPVGKASPKIPPEG